MKSILTLLLFVSQMAFAGTATTEGTGSTKMNAGNSVNNSASKGKSSQESSAGANQMAGMAFTMACLAGCSNVHKYACYACPLGAMALSQAMANKGAAGESGATYDASLSDGGYNAAGVYGDGTTPTGATDGSGTQTASTIQANLDKLKALGYKVNPDGSVTTPEGTFAKENFSSAGAMAGAGYSPSDIKAASAMIDKINKQIADEYGGDRVVSVGVDSSGGGGGSYGSYERKDDGFDDYLKSLRRGHGTGTANYQRMIAGKSINVGGEPLGVKGDNIFKMVERQYTNLNGRKEFLK